MPCGCAVSLGTSTRAGRAIWFRRVVVCVGSGCSKVAWPRYSRVRFVSFFSYFFFFLSSESLLYSTVACRVTTCHVMSDQSRQHEQMSRPALIGIGDLFGVSEGVPDLEIKGGGIGEVPAGCVWVLARSCRVCQRPTPNCCLGQPGGSPDPIASPSDPRACAIHSPSFSPGLHDSSAAQQKCAVCAPCAVVRFW